MALITKIKTDIVSATKARAEIRKNILKVLLGEVQTVESRSKKILSDQEVFSLIRSIINNNSITLDKTISEVSKANLTEEIEILQSYIPKTLTEKEILEHIDESVIKLVCEAKSEGQAVGIVIKFLKTKTECLIDGNDVKKIVQSFQQTKDTQNAPS